MNLTSDLAATSLDRYEDLGAQFGAWFPKEALDEALKVAKKPTERWRVLPNEKTLWLIVGMALFRPTNIAMVALKLRGNTRRCLEDGTSAAIVRARDALGIEPVKTLFRFTVMSWAQPSVDAFRWRGLGVYGVDGTCLRLADTEENELEFGRPKTDGKRGASGYPQLRLVSLMALRTREIIDVAVGEYLTGEVTLAKQLWPQLPENSLVVIDKGFIDTALFHSLMTLENNRHLLCRAKKNLQYRVVERLSANDFLVEINVPRQQRAQHPELPETLRLRAIRYQRRGYQPQLLLTSMLDAKTFPATEIRAMYHERWELELAYDEIKTHTLEREENHLRSRSPDRVMQELYGLLVAYNLTRHQIAEFAAGQGLSPLRISYRNALLTIRDTIHMVGANCGSPRKILALMEDRLSVLVLPERRSDRRYKRAVKIKMSNYQRNPKRGSTNLYSKPGKSASNA